MKDIDDDPADRTHFILSEDQWNAFWEMLEASISGDNTRLRKLMQSQPIWRTEDDDRG